MKARTLKDIERKVRQESDAKNAIFQYNVYNDIIDDVFKNALTAMIAVFHRRGRSKKYIQDFYKDFLEVLNAPDVFGKPIRSIDIMEQYSKEYGIDFDKVHVRRESLEEYKHRYKVREQE